MYVQSGKTFFIICSSSSGEELSSIDTQEERMCPEVHELPGRGIQTKSHFLQVTYTGSKRAENFTGLI